MSGLTFNGIHGFADVADSVFAAEQLARGSQLAKIADNAAFGMVRLEVFAGSYSHGQTVSLPVSPVDGYNYQRSELLYIWIPTNTGSASTNWASYGPPWTMWYGAWNVNQTTGVVTCVVGYRGNDDHRDRLANTNDSTLQVFTIAQRGLTTLLMAARPTYSDHPDTDFYADRALNTGLVTDMNESAKWGIVNTEVMYLGVFKHGQQVPVAVSPVDGYRYGPAETQYMTSMYWTADDNGAVPATMQTPAITKGQLSDWASSVSSTGVVSISVTYELGSQTTYHTGRVAVFAFGTRLKRTLQSTFNVNSIATPWKYTAGSLNTAFPINDSTFGQEVAVTPGQVIAIQWQSGTISVGSAFAQDTNADGYTNSPQESNTAGLYAVAPITSANPVSSVPNGGSVIGAFVDGSHQIVGQPFYVGVDSGAMVVPAGAAFISLGINDDPVLDNIGHYVMGLYLCTPVTSSAAGTSFVEQDSSIFAAGSTLRASTLQQTMKNIREAMMVPELFAPASYSDGQTVPLPTSPIDGYAYSRSELTYIFDWANTGPDSFASDRLVLASCSIDSAGTVHVNQYRFQSGGTNWQLEHNGTLRVMVFAKRQNNFTVVVAPSAAASDGTAEDADGAILVNGV